MILVTVGTQLPFDRLIRLIDEIAPDLSEPVLAQNGNSKYKPQNIEAIATIRPEEFQLLIKQARLIVSHAGIGTVLTAQRHCKPLVLVPRLAKFGEHRNDHQSATVRALRSRPGIYVAETDAELRALLTNADLAPATGGDHQARANLKRGLEQYLLREVAPTRRRQEVQDC